MYTNQAKSTTTISTTIITPTTPQHYPTIDLPDRLNTGQQPRSDSLQDLWALLQLLSEDVVARFPDHLHTGVLQGIAPERGIS